MGYTAESQGHETMFEAVEAVRGVYELGLASTRKRRKLAIDNITDIDTYILNQKLDLSRESDRMAYWRTMIRMFDCELEEWKSFWREGFDHWVQFCWEVEEEVTDAKAAMELVVHREEGRRRMKECMSTFLRKDIPLPAGLDLRKQVLRRLMGIICDYATGIERLELYACLPS